MSSSTNPPNADRVGRGATRSSLACIRCRVRRRRCSGKRPTCDQCQSEEVECQWVNRKKRSPAGRVTRAAKYEGTTSTLEEVLPSNKTQIHGLSSNEPPPVPETFAAEAALPTGTLGSAQETGAGLPSVSASGRSNVFDSDFFDFSFPLDFSNVFANGGAIEKPTSNNQPTVPQEELALYYVRTWTRA
jgi:hypothetical protein